MEKSGQLHALAGLPPGKQYPLYNRLGGSQSQSGRCGEEKNLLPLSNIEGRLLFNCVNTSVVSDCFWLWARLVLLR
jgi:hypothetical protein